MRAGAEHAVVAGGLLLGPQAVQAPPRQRMEPQHAPGEFADELRGDIPAPDMGELVEQHDAQPLLGPRSRPLRQEHDRPPPSPCHRDDRRSGQERPHAAPDAALVGEFLEERRGAAGGRGRLPRESPHAENGQREPRRTDNRACEPQRRHRLPGRERPARSGRARRRRRASRPGSGGDDRVGRDGDRPVGGRAGAAVAGADHREDGPCGNGAVDRGQREHRGERARPDEMPLGRRRRAQDRGERGGDDEHHRRPGDERRPGGRHHLEVSAHARAPPF